jgi:Fe-S cluster biosynthesis and repair protein YggX
VPCAGILNDSKIGHSVGPRNFSINAVCLEKENGDWLSRLEANMAETQPGAHTVMCVKFGKKMEGLDRVPWKGELGQKIYENVSKEAWKMWIEHSKMIMNEYRLNPLDPQSQKIMEEQMDQFFFGEGAKLPEGYVAPRAKG